MKKSYYVYILANKYNNVLYCGVTNDLMRRVREHREGVGSKFTRKYRVHKLVYMQEFGEIRDALHAEKSLKAATRARKEWLIKEINPGWEDLLPDG